MYLGIDLGTSSVKVVLIDQEQQVLGSSSASLEVNRPNEAWSEQNPAEWISATSACLSELGAQFQTEFKSVAGIGLSGHMHGATLLDQQNQVIRPCILWNDTRSAKQAEALDTEKTRELTGNITFPGFTSPKLLWVKENEPELFEKVAKVLLPKDYLRWWLTGEHVAEMSDASGTGWLNVAERNWSTELLSQTDLDVACMPRLVEGTEISGTIRPDISTTFGLPKAVPVAGGAGDNAASACGVGIVSPGNAFLSLGTSGVLFASNDSYRPNPASAVHTFCHALPDTWHQMGVILAATDSLNWWSRLTGKSPEELTKNLTHSDKQGEALFLPYLGGERTPHNDALARGTFLGLGHSSDLSAMTHAVLQGVSFAFRDCVNALDDAGTSLDRATVIGGGSQSAYWLQMLADTLDIPLDVTGDGNLGASLGAARLGLIAAESVNPVDVCTAPTIQAVYEPDNSNQRDLDADYQRYKKAYAALKQIC